MKLTLLFKREPFPMALQMLAVALLSLMMGFQSAWSQGMAEQEKKDAFIIVEVTGRAAVENGNPAVTQKKARLDALRNGVEKVIGAFIDARTRTEDFRLVEDKVLSKIEGFASIETGPLNARTEDGVYQATYKVKVFFKRTNGNKALLNTLRDSRLLRDIRVAVIVPETHMQRVIRDPAAQTAIESVLQDFGFRTVNLGYLNKLKNPKSARRFLTYDTKLEEILDPENLKKLWSEVDLLVIGEGISETVVSTLPTRAISCRAQVELTAILADTGESIASLAERNVAAADMSEALASKQALQLAGDKIARDLITKLINSDLIPAGKVHNLITLEARGWESLSQAKQFLKELENLDGIQEVRFVKYRTENGVGILEAEINLTKDAREDFANALEQDKNLKSFGLRVHDETKGKILAVRKSERAERQGRDKLKANKPKIAKTVHSKETTQIR